MTRSGTRDGRQDGKSATMGGRVGNRHRIRRSGASRWPAAAAPLYVGWPAGSPCHRPAAMKRIFVRSRCQGRPLLAGVCTGPGATFVRPRRMSTSPRHGTSDMSWSRPAGGSGWPSADRRTRQRQAAAPARWRRHAAIVRCRCGLRPSLRLSRRKPSSVSVSPRWAKSSPRSVLRDMPDGGVGSTGE